VQKVFWRDQLPDILSRAEAHALLPHGMGRSYGDSCVNDKRDLLDCTPLNRILDFDWQTGRIRVEAGLSLANLLEVIVPHGWFLPVTPGTKFVTIGGAIANDVHGKNHHRAGTFGLHVKEMLIYRSDAGDVICNPATNADLFAATIGGLGLTGVIAWAELQLKRISGNGIEAENVPFENLNEFLELSAASDRSHEYTVAWVDCLSGSNTRGIFIRGNHAAKDVTHRSRTFAVPFAIPSFVLNRTTVSLFNRLFYRLKARKKGTSIVHYEPFFYPLDALRRWNLLYGNEGFVQYQCVIPHARAAALEQVVAAVSASGYGSFLTVLKAFADIPSPGLLSFPRPGLTLAMDLPMRGASTLKLLDSLDELVLRAGGAVYPAKDARMSPRMFQASFPKWKEFETFIDPKFSSSFWRRVATE
jgi:FAD/FMN-containing dehydrogenase